MKMKLSDKKRMIKALVAAAVGVLIIVTLFCQSRSVFTDRSDFYPTETFVQLENGKPVTQNITVSGANPVLQDISIMFATNARVNEGDVKVELLSGEEVLCSWDVDAAEILDNAIRGFDAKDGITLSSDGVYTIRITETFEGENNIAVGASTTGFLSCTISTYDSGRCLKWFLLMSFLFIVGYIVLLVWGGLLEYSYTKLIVTGLVASLVIFIIGFDLFPSVRTTLEVKPVPSSTGVWDTIEPGGTREYTFTCDSDAFEDLEIFTGGENVCDLELTLINTSTGTVYYDAVHAQPEWHVSTGRICTMLSADKSQVGQRYYENGVYELKITNLSSDKTIDVELEAPVEEGQTGIVTYAGIRYTSLGIKIVTLAIAMMFIYLVVLNVLREAKKLTVERFFLITVIPLSIMYLLFFQPWNVPDCGAHFLASYRASNLLLGINGRLEWFARSCDAAYYNGISWWSERKPDLEGIASMIHGLNRNDVEVSLVDQIPHETKMVYYSTINWMPQSIGLAIGRLIGLGPVLTVFIARVLTLATFILCCYRAIKNTPVGKIIFASAALLPVSLMMSSSFSYDCMVIIVTLNFTAIIFKLRKEYSNDALIEAIIWAFILGAIKGGSVLLILPLALLLIKKNKKSAITVCSVIGTALLSVLIFDKLLPTDELFQFGEENSGNMMTAFAYTHPVEYLKMLVRTYVYFGDTYVNQAMGRELSYLEPVLSSLSVAGALISALVYSTFEKDELELGKKDRIVSGVIILLAFVMTPAMLLSYTPVGSGMIYGIQGRYLFSVFPLLMIFITKFGLRRTGVNIDEDKKTLSVNACTNVYVTFTIIMLYTLLKLYLSR